MGPRTSTRKKRKPKSDLADECGTIASNGGLPPELLHCIAQRLDFFPDLASFASVCTSWRSIKRDIVWSHNWFRGQSPLLLLSPLADKSECASSSSPSRRELFSLSHGRGFELRFPVGKDRKKLPKLCIGASRGWLVLLDRKKLHRSDVLLLNPFTKASVRLPPVSKTKDNFRDDHKYLFVKVAISGDPLRDYKGGSSSPGPFMVLMFWGRHNLLIWRPGDTHWTAVQNSKFWCYSEVFLFQGLYRAILKDDGLDSVGCLTMISFDPCCKSNDLVAKQMVRMRFPILESEKSGPKYLVESSGQLLLISRLFNDFPYSHPEYKTSGFDVFRLDGQQSEWMEVHSLGEQMIFVGCNETVSLSSRDHPGWRGNCIYFTFENRCVSFKGFRDSGVFDFGDRTVPPFPILEKPLSEPLLWLIQDKDNDCKT